MKMQISKYWQHNLIKSIFGLTRDSRSVDRFDELMSVEGNLDIVNRYIEEAVSNLTERETQVIYARYKDHMTLDQIARMLNITRERVRQIEAKVLRKLRHPSRSSKLKRIAAFIAYSRWFKDKKEITHEDDLMMYHNAIYVLLKGPGIIGNVIPETLMFPYFYAITEMITSYQLDDPVFDEYPCLRELPGYFLSDSMMISFKIIDAIDDVWDRMLLNPEYMYRISLINHNIKMLGDWSTMDIVKFLTTDHTDTKMVIQTKTVILNPNGEIIDTMEEEEKETDPNLLEISIENLDLSVRSFNCLKRVGINTVGDAIQWVMDKGIDGFQKIRNLGIHSYREVVEKLNKINIDLTSYDKESYDEENN
jgi:DNA-binding CsgD family transcriptional regulator